ncbi:predicted protein [Naegleria gruberi]|uniref:Predicted protein n=1 Tax=Naegleria gruberi TaxID=5762 RepID=D2W3C5_NAEGR|nr:uncharacterized protein NAEGRDRAFT_54393 [Naegleria gruberi]EFC36393.1 predicted protein [Naegleria gruberi]|eukprot:XP_002669137.1 predicted protein [Naegleria gruberi strain NEG-M]
MMRRTTIPKVINTKLLPSYCGIQRQLPSSSSIITTTNNTTGASEEETDSQSLLPNSSRTLKQYHNPSIKPFERDLMNNAHGTGFHVFRPYVNLVAPSFVKTVLDNEQLMNKLDDFERQVIQRIIQHIYQEASLEFELDDVDCLCRFLFLLQSCSGELVEVKRNLLQCLQHKITVSNVLDVLDSIDNHIQTLQSFGNSPSNDDYNLLNAVKSYCFSFIRQHVFDEEFDIKLNPRVEKHIFHFYNKKEQDFIEYHEKPNENSSPFIFEELFNEGEPLEYDFTIDFGDGIFIRTHKTILASNSLFFESMLSSSGASFVDVDKSIFYPDNSINASAVLLSTAMEFSIPLTSINTIFLLSFKWLTNMTFLH